MLNYNDNPVRPGKRVRVIGGTPHHGHIATVDKVQDGGWVVVHCDCNPDRQLLFYRADVAGYVPPVGESIENPEQRGVLADGES